MNNKQNNMVHYRIKSTAKSQKESSPDITLPLVCTAATIFSAVSAAMSVAVFKKIRRKR